MFLFSYLFLSFYKNILFCITKVVGGSNNPEIALIKGQFVHMFPPVQTPQPDVGKVPISKIDYCCSLCILSDTRFNLGD